jgi:hypothetical protein
VKAGGRKEAMSESMIERVARALFLDRFPDSEDYWPDLVGACELGSADDYRGYARTAIKAMREPTDHMMEVYKHAFVSEKRFDGRKVYGDMIDAALKEKDPTAD